MPEIVISVFVLSCPFMIVGLMHIGIHIMEQREIDTTIQGFGATYERLLKDDGDPRLVSYIDSTPQAEWESFLTQQDVMKDARDN